MLDRSNCNWLTCVALTRLARGGVLPEGAAGCQGGCPRAREVPRLVVGGRDEPPAGAADVHAQLPCCALQAWLLPCSIPHACELDEQNLQLQPRTAQVYP